MPERTFRRLGDLMTKALITGDFALYRDVLSLPMTFFPKGGKPFILPDEAALKANFDLYVAIIRLHGVTDIYRQVLGYDQIGPDDVRLRILTHILVRANLLAEPFAMQMLLQRRDGLWRIAEIESSIGHLNWTMGRAVAAAGHFELKETED